MQFSGSMVYWNHAEIPIIIRKGRIPLQYDFDTVIDRHGTCSMKWSLAGSTRPGFEHVNDDTIPMMVADMDLQCPQCVIDAMHRVADHKIYGYSSHTAQPLYFTSLCGWFARRHGWQILPEQILPSHGTFGALTHIANMMTREGEGILVLDPVYGHFSQDIVKWGRQVVRCHLRLEDGRYTIDFDLLEKLASDPNNTLLIFCNPHNPVGRVWTAEEIRRVDEICRRNGVFVISDEVHCDILRRGVSYTPYLTVCGDKSKAVSMVGTNKSFNMAGLSCSNAIIQDEALYARILKTYPMPMLSPFAIEGQAAAYSQGDEWMDQVCDYIDGNIDWAIAFFRKTMPRLKITRPEGTYCLWMDFRDYGLSDEEVHRRIYLQANVLLQDGTVHDPVEGQCWQRMCVPCARSVLETACRRIAEAFSDL